MSEVKRRLEKFISVKIYVFTLLWILVLLNKDISRLTEVAIIFFAVRGLQYYLEYKKGGRNA